VPTPISIQRFIAGEKYTDRRWFAVGSRLDRDVWEVAYATSGRRSSIVASVGLYAQQQAVASNDYVMKISKIISYLFWMILNLIWI